MLNTNDVFTILLKLKYLKILFQVGIYIHLVISVVSATFTTTQAISVYLFAIAALLLAVILLMIIHWRHQINQRSKERNDGISPLTIQDYPIETEEKYQLMNSQRDETDSRNLYSQPGDPNYYSYNSFNRVDDDLKNIPYQRGPGYERAYHPVVGTPMVPMNHYQFYPNINRGQSTYPNESVYNDGDRRSHYDNLAPNYHPNYQVNYLKNSDLI